MSNTRKIRMQHGEPPADRERERRHLAFLRTGNNPAALADETRAQYDKHGRGFWITSDSASRKPAGTEFYYIPIGDITVFPAGRQRDAVERMVQTYDPARQVVVVIEEDGAISAYQLRLIEFADPALN